MREQVCIVLNERESAKAKTAEALEKQLKSLNITSSRIPVDKGIEATVRQRSPMVVVLDYLLGDFSTGLDVMSGFQKMPPERRPAFIFFTDEPSIQVAVEAMKGGALDFLSHDDPQALHKLCSSIQDILRKSKHTRPTPSPDLKLDDLVSVSPKFRSTLKRLNQVVTKKTPVVILHGSPGSGLSAIAKAALLASQSQELLIELDCGTYFKSILDRLGINRLNSSGPSLGNRLSCLLDHAENEHAELLELLLQNSKRIWPGNAANNGWLCVCTNSIDSARAWQKIECSELILVPDLIDRTDDIAPLAVRFLKEAENCVGKRIKLFGPDLLSWLSAQKWPGNVRQLRAVVVDVAISSTLGSTDLQAAMVERKLLWEEEAAIQSTPVNPLLAAVAIEMSNGNLRRAAARLGCRAEDLINLAKLESGYE